MKKEKEGSKIEKKVEGYKGIQKLVVSLKGEKVKVNTKDGLTEFVVRTYLKEKNWVVLENDAKKDYSIDALNFIEQLNKHNGYDIDVKMFAKEQNEKNTNKENNNKGEVQMKKEKELKAGVKMLLKVKDQLVLVTVKKVEAKVVTVVMPDGNERKFLFNIVRKQFENQDELEEEFAKAKSEEIDDVDDDDDADEDDEEEDEKPSKKNNKKDNKKSNSKSAKKNEKYWETEEPIFFQTEGNEFHFYEEAGKFQIFRRIKDGKAISKGVTIDVAECSEEEAIKIVSNICYAFKTKCQDKTFQKVVETIEKLNKETNPADYVFTKAELKEMDNEKLSDLAHAIGCKVKPNMSDTKLIESILKKQDEE